MVEALISFFGGLLLNLIRGALSDYRRDKALERAGAAEAALVTADIIRERTNAQRQNDMADRGGASDVARRLRERIQGGDE